jgi:hypothetical protein
MIVDATQTGQDVLPTRKSGKRNLDTLSCQATEDISLRTPSGLAVDITMLQRYTPLTFEVIFQTFPTWILALDPVNVRSVRFPGYSAPAHLFRSLDFRGQDSSLIQRALSRLGASKVVFGSSPTLPNVRLVSGTLSFLVPYFNDTSTLVVGVVDGHFHGRLRNQRPPGIRLMGLNHVSWERVRHTSVGGCTTFIALFGINQGHISPRTTILRRTIRHFLDHSVRPAPFRDGAQSFLTGDDILNISNLGSIIKYPTSFSHNGWGMRSLTADELGSVYGLHYKLRVDGIPLSTFGNVTPVGLLDSILSSVSASFTTSHNNEPASILVGASVPPPSSTISHRTWLPDLQTYLSHDWIAESLVTDKAAKRDDADIPVFLWDKRITLLFPAAGPKLNWLRARLLFLRTRALYKEFTSYLSYSYGASWAVRLRQLRISTVGRHQGGDYSLLRDAAVGADAISKFSRSTWFQWTYGSTLFFWRWGRHKVVARDGFSPFIHSTLPSYTTPAKRPKKDKIKLLVPKFKLILERGYVQPGPIRSFIDYFEVPKADDIRLVYNGSSCGLYSSLWAPNFWLPTARTALRSLDFNYFSVDMDLGDMFLNFPLHSTLQSYSGIDLTPLKEPLGITTPGPYHVHWTRCWMGAKPSPFYAVSYYYLSEEFIRGDHLEKGNPLRWDSIQINIPGDPKYTANKPRVYKWDDDGQHIAGDVVVFVDDLRGTGPTVEHAWRVSRRTTSRIQYLGKQDASRKHRPPTQTPGAWAGSVFRTTATSVTKLVSQDKWAKAKTIVSSLHTHSKLDRDKTMFNYKELERARGFLVHMSMTYEMLRHHIKGFHLTLSSYFGHRDSDGWKLGDHDWAIYLQHKLEVGDEEGDDGVVSPNLYSRNNPPLNIKPVPQLLDDLYALDNFFQAPHPPAIDDRNAEVRILLYGFADASGGGLGSSVWIPGCGIRCRTGVWGRDEEGTSCNFKEFHNVVLTVEQEANEGTLTGAQMLLFTDNATVEAALYKGNSSNRKLFELIVRLRKVQMDCGATILVSHVSGKRMIAQGTDGISRGELKEGISQGASMLSFIPLHLSAIDRSIALKEWIMSWAGNEVEFLTPEGWFSRGHGHDGGSKNDKGFWLPNLRPGTFVWSPPPGAADVALEELRKSLIKRQDSTHIFICPRLLTCEWRRQLHKAADLVMFLPPGSDSWPDEMYEPLTIGFVFPFLPYSPWQLRGTPKMLYLARELPKMLLTEKMAGRHILREFFIQHRSLSRLSQRVVRKVLFFR